MERRRQRVPEATIIPLSKVPKPTRRLRVWDTRFAEIPAGKAALIEATNRQRAHQLVNSVRSAAIRCGVKIGTRVIHGEPVIHGTDKWLVYYWRI